MSSCSIEVLPSAKQLDIRKCQMLWKKKKMTSVVCEMVEMDGSIKGRKIQSGWDHSIAPSFGLMRQPFNQDSVRQSTPSFYDPLTWIYWMTLPFTQFPPSHRRIEMHSRSLYCAKEEWCICQCHSLQRNHNDSQKSKWGEASQCRQ